jgi:hypothetical protein
MLEEPQLTTFIACRFAFDERSGMGRCGIYVTGRQGNGRLAACQVSAIIAFCLSNAFAYR